MLIINNKLKHFKKCGKQIKLIDLSELFSLC